MSPRACFLRVDSIDHTERGEIRMKVLSLSLAVALALLCPNLRAATFNYHGSLQDAGRPAEGSYDLELTLYSAPEGGRVLGGPLTMYKVPVHDGGFSTEADFGPLTYANSDVWLAVKVRNANGGEFSSLSGRAPIGANATAAASCPGSWGLMGNAGNPPGTSYLGTADAQPLTIKVSNLQVANAFLGSGILPSWVGGGSMNFSINANGSFIGGGGSSTTSGNANGVGPYGVVGGGLGNQAGVSGVSYSTVGGGISNHASGSSSSIGGGGSNTASNDYTVVGGGTSNTASGLRATVPGGSSNVAAGAFSLAAGQHAQANHDGSFVWGDDSTSSNFASTATNQFDVRAAGGMAINGAPKDFATELSIYPSSAGANYSNQFFGLNSTNAGILISAGDATPGHNDASFYFDQFDGSSYLRKLIVNSNGLSINGQNTANVNGHPALSLLPGPGNLSGQVEIDIVPGGNGAYGGYFDFSAATFSNAGQFGDFYLSYVDANQTLHNLAEFQSDNGNDSFTISGNAYKPGGGAWSSTSDRRVKQDIVPIGNAVETLLKLRPISYRYTPQYRAMEGNLPDKTYMGFVAQEFAEVFPDAVTSTGKRMPGATEGDAPILALDSSPALITVVAAVQELAVENQKLQSENAALHEKLDDVIVRLGKLEKNLGE